MVGSWNKKGVQGVAGVQDPAVGTTRGHVGAVQVFGPSPGLYCSEPVPHAELLELLELLNSFAHHALFIRNHW
jgi:hypothetical protein